MIEKEKGKSTEKREMKKEIKVKRERGDKSEEKVANSGENKEKVKREEKS